MFLFDENNIENVIGSLFDQLYYMFHVDILDAPSYQVSAEEIIMTGYYDNLASGEKPDGGVEGNVPIGKIVL